MRSPFQNEERGLNAVVFSSLYRAHVGSVYNYVGYRLGYDVAEDITAEIFSKAWQKRKQYNAQKGTPKTWLWSIALHAVIDQMRRVQPAIVVLDETVHAPTDMPFEMVTLEEKQQIICALSHLKTIDQEIIILRFWCGETNRSIAPILGLTESAVAQRLRRALKKMRQHFEQ